MPGPFNKQLWDFGQKVEDEVCPKLNKLFNADFKRDESIWDILDFHDDNKKIICEIKGRKIKSTQFKETIIPMNKLSEGFNKIELGYRVFFVFVFTDTSLYIELKEGLVYSVKLTGTNYIEHALIPVMDLVSVE